MMLTSDDTDVTGQHKKNHTTCSTPSAVAEAKLTICSRREEEEKLVMELLKDSGSKEELQEAAEDRKSGRCRKDLQF